MSTLSVLTLIALLCVLQSRHGAGRIRVESVTSPVTHAEGPHWDSNAGLLYYVDISNGQILTFNQSNNELKNITVEPGNLPVSLVIPINGTDDLLATRGLELVLVNPSTGNVTRIITSVDQSKPANRFNDGKADPMGRLWAGTMGPEEAGVGVVPDQGTLYVMNDQGTMVPTVSEIDVSNGLAWNSQNDKMYYIDTGTNKIDVFDYDINTGNITNRRTAFDFSAYNVSGSPDSMTIDTNDTLWVACWGGSQVVRIDPVKEELLAIITIPARYVTSVTFGGSQLNELFVTTSRRDLTPEEILEEPLAGSVFKVTGLGVFGLPGVPVTLPSL